MFNTSRYWQTFSQCDSTILCSHQQYHEDFSTSIPILIIWLFHSGGCKLLSHCNFDLYSLNANYAFFHKFIGHLCMFFGEMSILILCPLYVACPFVVEFKSSLYILDVRLILHIWLVNIFSHFVSSLLTFLDLNSFWCPFSSAWRIPLSISCKVVLLWCILSIFLFLGVS